jgi:hypothetical protein
MTCGKNSTALVKDQRCDRHFARRKCLRGVSQRFIHRRLVIYKTIRERHKPEATGETRPQSSVSRDGQVELAFSDPQADMRSGEGD